MESIGTLTKQFLARAEQNIEEAQERRARESEDAVLPEQKFPYINEHAESSIQQQGVPKRLASVIRSDKFIATKAIKAVQKWVEQDQEAWCLVLSGGKGCGKSTAAAYWLYLMARERLKEPNQTPSKTRGWWSATRVSRLSSYSDKFETMLTANMMVIDDLGVEYVDKNGHFAHRLDELIDERYSNYRRTLITTNLNAPEFKTRYGERVADRLREGFSHGGMFFEISDKSLRG